MRRVVITGMGIVSPLGLGVEHVWRRLLNGESGVRTIQQCDITDLQATIAGEIPLSEETGAFQHGLLNLNDYIEPKDQRKIGKYIAYSLVAADEALNDAGWHPTDQESLERTGVLIGAGIGGLEGLYDSSVTLFEKGPRRVTPFFIPSCLINLAPGHVSIRHGFKGPNHSVVTACSTGAHSIGDAARLIQHGDADVMVAGSTESTVCRLGIAGFAAMRALSTRNDAPTEASRPWDRDRDGFVMGEGAGVVILEELEHAKKRGVKIYGEVAGYGLSGDAYHVSAPSVDGDGAYRAMRASLQNAQINPEQVDYLNAHATSTPAGDPIEIAALRRLYGEKPKLSMSSTKSAIGHLLGGAGSVEAIFSILSIRDNIVPPTLNLHNPCEGSEGIDLVPLKAKERKVDVALSNSFGFGGTNASLVFKRFK